MQPPPLHRRGLGLCDSLDVESFHHLLLRHLKMSPSLRFGFRFPLQLHLLPAWPGSRLTFLGNVSRQSTSRANVPAAIWVPSTECGHQMALRLPVLQPEFDWALLRWFPEDREHK